MYKFLNFRAFVNVTSCHFTGCSDSLGIGDTLNALHATPKIAMFFTTVGTTILEQLGILFAIGVAIGMAKKNDGAVALAATLGYFLVTVVLSPMKLAPLLGMKASEIN